ncbi:uncharacterized protein PSFLO_01681 [Pseudozyma flocculosa]|uniref:Cytochrome P450 n=1 Tax=Pseudozyma flocculosa TaxID=84751 RepID=A0A5C3EWH2_9BASI|nr:uncharacterized protein PSFLO_01681 [Pseudozyma flocculosa]
MLLLLDLAQHAPRWTAHHFVNPYTALASLVLTAIAAALSFVRLSTASKNDKARGQASAPPHPHHPPSPPPTSRLLGHRGFPVYDAAFNLRLSYLYGPIILLQHGPAHPLHLVASLLPSFLRPLLPAVAPTWRPHDTTILVNSEQHARHILDRLGAHYSSRAPSIAAGKYLSHGRRLVLQPYGPVWRTHHRALMSVLSRDKLRGQWDPVMRYEAAEMVLRIADGIEAFRASATHPPSIFQETSRFTASSVLQIAYARRAATPQDPVLVDLDRVSQGIARAFEPGRFLVERLPILDLVPSWLAPWKQRLQAWHRAEHDVYSGLVQDVQDRLPSEPGPGHKGKRQQTDLAGGSILSPSSCATATLLSMRQKLHLDVDDISYISATIFEAGTETTATTIDTFLVAMACYPEVARRLRAELDRLFVPASSLGGAGGEGDDDDDEERWLWGGAHV